LLVVLNYFKQGRSPCLIFISFKETELGHVVGKARKRYAYRTDTQYRGPVIVDADPMAETSLSDCNELTIAFTSDKGIQNCPDVGFTEAWSISSQSARDNVFKMGYKAEISTTAGTTASVCDNPDCDLPSGNG
jgi:hypothetical protein